MADDQELDVHESGQADAADPELPEDPFLAELNAQNLRPADYAARLLEEMCCLLQ